MHNLLSTKKNVGTVQRFETLKYLKKIVKISQLGYNRTFIDQIIDKIEQIFHQITRQKRNQSTVILKVKPCG